MCGLGRGKKKKKHCMILIVQETGFMFQLLRGKTAGGEQTLVLLYCKYNCHEISRRRNFIIE